MTTQSLTSLALAELYAPVLSGVVISGPLYGIAVAQAVFYYWTYLKDRRALKILVGILVLLDGAHTFCLAHTAQYWYLQIKLAPIMPKSFLSTFFLSYITRGLVQIAYAKRVWYISGRRKFVTGVLLMFSVIQLVTGIGLSINLTIGGSPLSAFTSISKVLGGIQITTSMICDVLISISLVYFLNNCRSGFRRTENLIDRLVVYSIGIGLVTSILSLVVLLIWYTTHNFDFLPFYFLNTKVYVNSFLVTLNSRAKSQRDLSTQQYESEDTSSSAQTTSDMAMIALPAS